jgi:hypothetical protein
MLNKNLIFIFLVAFFAAAIVAGPAIVAAPAFAQGDEDGEDRTEEGDDSAKEEKTVAPEEPVAEAVDKQKKSEPAADPGRPWCVLAGRLAFGGGQGSFNGEWDFMNNTKYYEEDVDMESVSHSAFIPEVFFMPTQARQFIISASIPMGSGQGKLDSDFVFQDDDFNYGFTFFNLGLGYQWFFGPLEKTNLMLMTHLGSGRFWMRIEPTDDMRDERKTRAMKAWDFDLSIGSFHRFDNRFVFGATLDYWALGFNDQAGSEDYVNTYAKGGLAGMRLNLLAGYAF